MTTQEEFMEDIFQRTDFLFYLFNEAIPFKGSEFEGQLQTQFNMSEEEFLSYPRKYQESAYLAKHSNWLIADKDEKFYGQFHNHIVVCDQEGLIDYYCENFHDIPFVMWGMKQEDWQKAFQRHWLLEKNIDVLKKFEEYKKFCESYGLIVPNPLKKYEFESLMQSVELAV